MADPGPGWSPLHLCPLPLSLCPLPLADPPDRQLGSGLVEKTPTRFNETTPQSGKTRPSGRPTEGSGHKCTSSSDGAQRGSAFVLVRGGGWFVRGGFDLHLCPLPLRLCPLPRLTASPSLGSGHKCTSSSDGARRGSAFVLVVGGGWFVRGGFDLHLCPLPLADPPDRQLGSGLVEKPPPGSTRPLPSRERPARLGAQQWAVGTYAGRRLTTSTSTLRLCWS